MPRLAVPVLIVATLTLATAACGPVTLDPTELTRTVHIENRLRFRVVLQLCTSSDCSHHAKGDLLAPGAENAYNVEDTARNPFRVLTVNSHDLGCFIIGPKIRQDAHLSLTRARIGPC